MSLILLTSNERNSFFLVVTGIMLVSCTKSNSTHSNIIPAGSWQLLVKNQDTGPYNQAIIPSADSTVYLLLNPNYTYTSGLNGKTISTGSYSITRDTTYPNDSVLELNNFKTTGIFTLFTVEEISSNGQILSTYDGFTMHTSNDTLTLTGALAPGGFVSYVFKKQ